MAAACLANSCKAAAPMVCHNQAASMTKRTFAPYRGDWPERKGGSYVIDDACPVHDHDGYDVHCPGELKRLGRRAERWMFANG